MPSRIRSNGAGTTPPTSTDKASEVRDAYVKGTAALHENGNAKTSRGAAKKSETNPTLAETPATAPQIEQGAIAFRAGWTHMQAGEIVAGKSVHIEYDTTRMPGIAAETITAHIRFQPSGLEQAGPIVERRRATPLDPPRSRTVEFMIPAGTREIEIWFRTEQSGRAQWDSNLGNNWRFQVR